MKITREQLTDMRPCGLEARLALFGRRKSMTAKRALEAGASVRDVLWVVGRLGRKDLCVRFALACAQRVAYLTTDPRSAAALAAAQAWLDDPSEENRMKAYATDAACAAAARAAYAAANAAYAEREAQKAILIELLS